jgi:uncharacterized SAM-binding protein YcdF (DUF218 family)
VPRQEIVIAALVIAGWLIVSWGTARWLIVSQPLTNADAIVVLSGSATFRERTRHAASLYKEGRSKKIILTNDNLQSGWSRSKQRNPYYYERALDELLRAGVVRQDIEVLTTPVASTYDEAVLLKSYLENHGAHSLLIVTSAYHSRRALWTFRHVLQDSAIAVGIDAVRPGIQTPRPGVWFLSAIGWEVVPTEYLKIVSYWFRFR